VPDSVLRDLTFDIDEVHASTGGIEVNFGGDMPEDVLGGINTALGRKGEQNTRCIVHIADALLHGIRLHVVDDCGDSWRLARTGPHGLLYEPLVKGWSSGTSTTLFSESTTQQTAWPRPFGM